MVLQISKTVGIYEINGNLNSLNVFYLNKLIHIIDSAVFAIVLLCKKALGDNKLFSSIGRENNSVIEQFKTVKLIPILSSGSL
jgi:hypothetical protein